LAVKITVGKLEKKHFGRCNCRKVANMGMDFKEL
jgi:hypothetical protein